MTSRASLRDASLPGAGASIVLWSEPSLRPAVNGDKLLEDAGGEASAFAELEGEFDLPR